MREIVFLLFGAIIDKTWVIRLAWLTLPDHVAGQLTYASIDIGSACTQLVCSSTAPVLVVCWLSNPDNLHKSLHTRTTSPWQLPSMPLHLQISNTAGHHRTPRNVMRYDAQKLFQNLIFHMKTASLWSATVLCYEQNPCISFWTPACQCSDPKISVKGSKIWCKKWRAFTSFCFRFCLDVFEGFKTTVAPTSWGDHWGGGDPRGDRRGPNSTDGRFSTFSRLNSTISSSVVSCYKCCTLHANGYRGGHATNDCRRYERFTPRASRFLQRERFHWDGHLPAKIHCTLPEKIAYL